MRSACHSGVKGVKILKRKVFELFKNSFVLYLEKHRDFYRKHIYLSIVFILMDAVLINPVRRIGMWLQEKNVDSNKIEEMIACESVRQVEFLMMCIGDFKDSGDKKSNGIFDYFKFSGPKYRAEALVNDKFKNDKCFVDNDKYIFLFDGVIFNLDEIGTKHSLFTVEDIVMAILLREDGDRILNDLRGEFAGVLYNKANEDVKFFVDHFSMKKMFYFFNDSKLVVSTNFDALMNVLKLNDIKYNISKESTYMLLTFGYIIEDNTIVKDVKKLEGGIIASVCNGELQKRNYYEINNEVKTEETYDEIIEKVDLHFKKAVRRQFDKNLEYGYKQLSTLSGGLDSRIVSIVANDLDYSDIKTITFGQKGTWDEKIASDISKDYGFEWDFFPLDDANHIFNLSYGLKISGQTIFSESAKGAKYFFDNFKKNESYGLIHTGQAGDVVLGYFGVKSNLENNKTLMDTVASKILLHRVSDNLIKGEYKNQEELLLKQRVFNSTFYGNADYEQGRSSYSPFMDVDFFNYCMTIPAIYRNKHKIYKDWILCKYVDASRYKWEKIDDYISEGIRNKSQDEYKPLFYSMNPHDYWYYSNASLRVFIKNCFAKVEEVDIFNSMEQLKNDLKYMYKKGSTREKLQVITVVALIDRYWGSNK